MSGKILISHRGNTNGKNPLLENSPNYLDKAVSLGYAVETDLWNIKGQWVLGHDKPIYPIDSLRLYHPKYWYHCKNIEALERCMELRHFGLKFFWHEQDNYALTSNGYLWVYPGKHIPEYRGIAVLPERVPNWDITFSVGVCSDYIERYKVGP